MDTVTTEDRAALISRMGIGESTWWSWKKAPHLARGVALKALAQYLTEKMGTPVTVDSMLEPLV